MKNQFPAVPATTAAKDVKKNLSEGSQGQSRDQAELQRIERKMQMNLVDQETESICSASYALTVLKRQLQRETEGEEPNMFDIGGMLEALEILSKHIEARVVRIRELFCLGEVYK